MGTKAKVAGYGLASSRTSWLLLSGATHCSTFHLGVDWTGLSECCLIHLVAVPECGCECSECGLHCAIRVLLRHVLVVG